MADTINADVKIQLNDGVRIYLKDSSFLTGLLYSLDPENGNVLLLFYEDDPQNMRMKMIMAHAIQRIEKDEDIHQKMTAWMHEHIDMNISSKREIRVKVSETTVTEKELHKLTQFLQERFIPFQVFNKCTNKTNEDSLRVELFGGSVVLYPPFEPTIDAECVECGNEQILSRVCALLKEFHKQK